MRISKLALIITGKSPLAPRFIYLEYFACICCFGFGTEKRVAEAYGESGCCLYESLQCFRECQGVNVLC